MKSKEICRRLTYSARILFRGSLMVLILLCVGFWAASVSAESTLSPPVQALPTRPRPTSAPAPPPTAVPPAPSHPKPDSPSSPGPAAGSPSSPTETLPSPTSVPATPYVDLTFEELGYGTSQLSGSQWIYLYLPRSFVPDSERSYLDLTISHVPPEPDKLSTVKVTLNRVPLAMVTLSSENAEPTTYRLYLQNVPLIAGRNELNLSLDTGEACGVRGAMVSVAVHGSSLFHLEYSLTQYPPDLVLYPIPFFEHSFVQEPVYVVLPNNPSATDLSAAVTIAAGLGKFSYGEARLVSVLDTQVSADIRDNHHLIMVGKKGANRLLDRLDLPLRLDDPSLSEEQGVIQELVSPWNPYRMILVVTGNSDEGLSKASQALKREPRLFRMQGPVAIVQEVLPPEPVESDPRGDDFTLAELGYEEEVVYGTIPHVIEYRFYMPLGWIATEDAWFTLYFGHARIASPTTSSLSVSFNNVPIESVLLDESNASEGTLEMVLPSWLIRSGRNRIRISIEMNLDGEDKCLLLDSQHLWAAVYSQSYVHLPFVSTDVEPALDLFPYPFDERPNVSSLILVLNDRPRQLDYDLMLQVAVGLGAVGWGDARALNVTTAGLVAQEDLKGQDLVLIGRPSVHSLMSELNDRLPQPFEPSSDILRPQLESVIFVQDPSRTTGLLEELAAPWDPERTILVITGTNDEGVVLAITALFSQTGALGGNVALVEESVGIRAFDTRLSVSVPRSRATRPDSDRALLVQLGERWW